jgi:biotin carboxyl carrier protein
MTQNVGNKIKVIVDDQEYLVEIKELSKDILEIVVNGQSFKVEISEVLDAKPEFNLESRTHQLSKSRGIDTRHVPGRESTLQTRHLIAPMPGDIVDIFVNVGDQVEAGQELCVIEAMKMKNVLRSSPSRSGKVAGVEISLGETVPYGKVLIRFE